MEPLCSFVKLNALALETQECKKTLKKGGTIGFDGFNEETEGLKRYRARFSVKIKKARELYPLAWPE